MSRSLKKSMGGKLGNSSDKCDKQHWHRSARRKINSQTRELETYFGKSIYTQVETYYDYYDDYYIGSDWELTSLLDLYDKPYYNYYDVGDTRGWASDGGSYLQYTKLQLTDKFNKDLIRNDYWEDYVRDSTDRANWLKSTTWWFRLLVCNKNLAGKIFTDRKEMDDWMIKNENRLISTWKKIHYGK